MLKKSRILLIYPSNPKNSILNTDLTCCEPLGLKYIAAPLFKNDYDISILDMRFDNNIEEHILKERPNIIGFSIPFTYQIRAQNAS